MKKKILILLLLITPIFADTVVIGGKSFTKEQISNFKLAYVYGYMIGHPKEIMGILWTESQGKKVTVGDNILKPFKRSYGVMQVKLGTYHLVKKEGLASSLPDKNATTEDELVELMTNPSFNISVATAYFVYMKSLCGSVDKAISGYNRGFCSESKKGSVYRGKVKNFMSYLDNSKFLEYIKKEIALTLEGER